MKICNACNKRFDLEEAQFCPYCGERLATIRLFCDNCGNVLQEDFCFCPVCATKTPYGKSRFLQIKSPIITSENHLSIFHWLDYTNDNIFKDYTVRNKDAFSYCIRDEKANDLRIVKHFTLEPDTLYHITVDVKTQNIVNKENTQNPLGACISTNDWYCSKTLLGTNDWQTLGIFGRTDENGKIFLSLNLGYTFNACSGCAWFENIRFERVDLTPAASNTWRFLAVVLTNTAIDVYDKDLNKHIQHSYKMSNEERLAIQNSLLGIERDLNADAQGLFQISVDTIECDNLCTDYTKTGLGYSISAPSASAYLKKNGIDISKYDHVIMIVSQPQLPANYFGLGGITIEGQIGFSFILHKDISASIEYLSGKRQGAWPSAIYVHEFLHSIEWYANSLRLPVPAVDGERFDYPNVDEFRLWYKDFIHKNLLVNGKRLGVDSRIWQLRPSRFLN